MFLGREIRKAGFLGRWFRALDRAQMEKRARDKLSELGLMTIQNISQAVENSIRRTAPGCRGGQGPQPSAPESSSWMNRRPLLV